MTRRLILIVMLVLGALAPSCGSKEDSRIHLAAILSLSGPAAAYGMDNRRGLELAVDVINERGGVGGRQVVLDVEDSAGEPVQAVALARRFAGDSSISAILGPTRTGEAVAVSKTLSSLGLAMMSVGSTGDWRSAAGEFNEWTFRSTRIDTTLIEPLLKAARDRFNIRTVAILSTSNDDYAQSVLPVYTRAIEALGMKLVGSESQMTGDTDRAPQLTKIKDMKPDGLVLNVLSSDAPTIAEQARRLGLAAMFIGTAGFTNPATWKLARRESLEGTLCADNFFAGSPRPVVREFVERYRKRFGSEPPGYAAYAYDGALLLADAMRRGGADRRKVRDALASTSEFEGVLGRITYHGAGDAQKSPIILKIVDGAYSLVE